MKLLAIKLFTAAVIVCSLSLAPLKAEGGGNKFSAVRRQTKTVKGYFCGAQAGNRAGDFYFRVGGGVKRFFMNFGQEKDNARIAGFKFSSMKIGNEYRISYRSESDVEFIQSIKRTGRARKTEPCPVE